MIFTTLLLLISPIDCSSSYHYQNHKHETISIQLYQKPSLEILASNHIDQKNGYLFLPISFHESSSGQLKSEICSLINIKDDKLNLKANKLIGDESHSGLKLKNINVDLDPNSCLIPSLYSRKMISRPNIFIDLSNNLILLGLSDEKIIENGIKFSSKNSSN